MATALVEAMRPIGGIAPRPCLNDGTLTGGGRRGVKMAARTVTELRRKHRLLTKAGAGPGQLACNRGWHSPTPRRCGRRGERRFAEESRGVDREWLRSTGGTYS